MDAVIASLASKGTVGPQTSKLLAGTGRDQVHMLVVATAERGLCGGFNTNIVRAARRHAAELEAAGKTVKLFLIGKKGRAALLRTHRSAITETVDLSGYKTVGFDVAQGIAADLIARFNAGEFDVATLFYSEFKSALVQDPQALQLVPVKVPAVADAGGVTAAVEYEPDEEAILNDLLPRNIAVQVYRALLENAASEQGARMTAMDNATRNAGDMINRLTLTYNRTRQAAITKELIEIISGAEAL
jgi:F-type H+-transporting ATPase subunit gamma